MSEANRIRVEASIGRTMVGREAAIEGFKKQFDQVLEGNMGLTVISGPPGAGKTFFVDQAAGLFTGGNATYLHGKFRQYENHALSAVAEVIEQAVGHILTLPSESLRHIKHDLTQRPGADPALILSICPRAEILLGPHKAVNIDSLEQLKYRVRKGVCRFLEVVSTALFPLIVFFDDLQWADTLSLSVIEALCQSHESINLQLVLAYRDAPAGLSLPRMARYEGVFLELSGLAYADIEEYVG